MKKFKGVKALAFSAIIAAICLVLVLITTFTTGIGLVLMFVLPLCAALVTLHVSYRYLLVYVVATLLMSLINFQLAIFIVFPSLISGIVFGILIKKYVQGYYIIFINSIVLLLLQIGGTYLINVIYNIDMINSIGTLLKLNSIGFKDIYFLFLFAISLTEISLTYVIITNELKKFNLEFNEKMNQFIPILMLTIVSMISSFVFVNICTLVSYLSIGFTFYFGVVLAYYIYSFHLKKRMLIMQSLLYVASIISIFILFTVVPKQYLPTVFLIIPFTELLTSIYIVIYQKVYKKMKITEAIFD